MQNEGTQSSSSTVSVASSMPMSSTSARSISSARPTPSCAPALTPVAEEEEIEPEDTHPTPAMQQGHDVPPPQAFPYVDSRNDVQVIARTPMRITLVQHVCHGLSDTEAHEAVINKNWYRQVADAEAPRIQSNMGVSSRARSSTASHDDVQYLLHALLQPSMENIEAFLADEMKEMEHEAAQHLLTAASPHIVSKQAFTGK